MTRKELLAIPERNWEDALRGCTDVMVFPSNRKHESGYACMDFVAVLEDGKRIRFGGYCDDLSLVGVHFRIDCFRNPPTLHIWNSHGKFTVESGISTITLTEDP